MRPVPGRECFAKIEAACEEWSPENVRRCAERQDLILECAYHMLRPGGRLCYSTCTFAPAEDEGSVARLLGRHGDLHVERCDLPEGFRPGRKEWAVWEENAGEGGAAVRTDGVEYTMRLLGEGGVLVTVPDVVYRYVVNGRRLPRAARRRKSSRTNIWPTKPSWPTSTPAEYVSTRGSGALPAVRSAAGDLHG